MNCSPFLLYRKDFFALKCESLSYKVKALSGWRLIRMEYHSGKIANTVLLLYNQYGVFCLNMSLKILEIKCIKWELFIYGASENAYGGMDGVQWIKDKLKQVETYRYIGTMGALFIALLSGIHFMNAGTSYDQAVTFRLFCIAFAVMLLILMDWKAWLTIPTLLYIPVCFFATRIAYEKHWIADTCEYQFIEIIRLGKLVIFAWGVVILAIIREWIKKAGWKRFKKSSVVLGILWIMLMLLLLIFQRGYFYVNFFIR